MKIKTVGFIGLGTMGRPMAQNLVRNGFRVRAYDVNRSTLEGFGDPIAAADSPREAALGTDIVITMLPDGPDVESAVLGPDGAADGMRRGAVLIDMSTIAPALTRRIGASLAERGIDMIDSPVGKTVDHAVAGTLTLMVGGAPAVVEAVRPVLASIGTDLFHCGGLGMGGAMKLVNNLLAASILAATSEALVIGS